MNIPTSIICRQNKTWFDSLSMDQLKELCRAANLSEVSRKKLDFIVVLCENKLSSSFAFANVEIIKDMCRARSLPVTGIKYELVLRVLQHDSASIQSSRESKKDEKDSAVWRMYHRLEQAIKQGSDVYRWLEETMKSIRCDFNATGDTQAHLAAFRDAESIFAVFIENSEYIPSAGADRSDNLSVAIDHLAFILSEVHFLLDRSEKKNTVEWILELDQVLSEYMIGDNSVVSLRDLVRLLEKDADTLNQVDNHKQPESTTKKCKNSSPRLPFQCLENKVTKKGPTTAIVPVVTKKKTKPKNVASKKEMVYKKMASVIRNADKDSDYVYGRLVRLMKLILREANNDCEALGLFRSAFLALIVHFEKMEHPGTDKNHNFSVAIEMLDNVVKAVLGSLSRKEKEENLRWMNDLRSLIRPHALEDIDEIPLNKLICMVRESRFCGPETKPRSLFR